jgi:regulatory protein
MKTESSQAKQKILRYCAYQERAHSEVRSKLYDIGVYGDQAEELISYLILEGFLNEERFAKTFAGGKFRVKKWGRIKIQNALEQKDVSKKCIAIGLKEIDQEDYEKALTHLLEEKYKLLDEPNLFVKRDKLSQYVIQKGYEPDLVWKIIKETFRDK